ncbi:hypothetical protein R1sor_001734 [Riccia sorocarpa]|uniref:SAM-dependent MTase RsmB/NOP-type domain-containing protein n=1 Tax=Riccia sorocarpa TaxID=122646 RepID=A0ABD3GZA5_9MARC
MGGRGRGGYRGGKRGRTQRRDFKDGRPDVWKKQRSEGEGRADAERGWQPFVTESRAYEKYYKKQGVVPEEEWDLFIETLKKPLPTCFRINGSGQFAQDIRDQMQHDFFDYLKEEVEVDGEMVEPVQPLEWYPGQLAWTLNFSRQQLRKLPILERIHEFLKQENEIGSITRQEAVSMLPPLFLKVEPHHRVLDMCAAPGSKTFQLLEMIHKADKPGCLPDGLVIANDLDVQRCHLLIHQTKRMCSPNILVTNHEAQHFPGLKKKRRENAAELKTSDGETGDGFGEVTSRDAADGETSLLFDRVLCDVPCSGDGTIRKAPDIWKKWHCGLGNGIHPLQIQIALRGVALLKVGGRFVYSTCSLNPVEDEAVVGEILRQAGGSLELLDVSSEMPGLKYRQGLKSWLVRDKRKWLCSASEVNRHRAGAIVPSMFPSGKGWDQLDSNPEVGSGEAVEEADNAEDGGEKDGGTEKDDEAEEVEEEVASELEVASLPLERCMRILPHDANSGGFFIAVFQKVAPFKVHPKLKEQKNERRQGNQSVGTKDDPGVSAEDAPAPVTSGKTTSDVVKDTEMEDQNPSVDVSAAAAPAATGQKKDIVPAKGAKAIGQNDDISPAKGAKAIGQKDDIFPAKGAKAIGQKDDILPAKGAEVGEADAGITDEVMEDAPEGVESLEGGRKETSGELRERKVQQQGKWKGVDPVLFLEDEHVIQSLINYYGIRDSFPLRGHLVTRSEDVTRLKRIYYVSASVSEVIKLNYRVGQHLKISSAGLKIFERQTAKETVEHCAFRLASEGLPVLLPHMTKQIVHVSRADFKVLLGGNAVPFHAFREADFINSLETLLPGCFVVVLPERTADGEVDLTRSTAVGCWRGRHNVSLLISKAEAAQMLQRLCLADEEPKIVENKSIEGAEPSIKGEQEGTPGVDKNATAGPGASAESKSKTEDPALVKE